MKAMRSFACLSLLIAMTMSCKKYREIGDGQFTPQQIYMPAAVEGNSVGGIYFINKVSIPDQVYRYTADVTGNKLNINLAVYRSGADTKGNVPVTVTVNTDTANVLLAAGRFPPGTEVLTLGKYNPPGMVTIADGQGYAPINFSIDLNFLLANLTKKFAIGIGVSSPLLKTAKYGTTILLIDPTFLVPSANFTTVISGRSVAFSNTSLNASSYTWNYGDGSPVTTGIAAPYTYAAPGTYTITLTATGALGSFNSSIRTATVVIL